MGKLNLSSEAVRHRTTLLSLRNRCLATQIELAGVAEISLPTEKGKALIAAVHPSLKDVALTAKWEQQLADMVDGNVSLETFESEIADFLRGLLPMMTSQGASLPAQAEPGFGQCPQRG